jgi:hypothetical protein
MRNLPMITGAHAIIYSTNPDADRAVLRDAQGKTTSNVVVFEKQ